MDARLGRAAEGALLGTLVGDALGAPYEGAATVSLAKGVQRAADALGQAPLPYTDDTQMALALADHLSARPEVDRADLAGRFLDVYEPWRGYGGGMRALVAEWRRGTAVEQAATSVFPDGSLGNGAAMRIAGVGVRWAGEGDRLTAAAQRSARTTHVHPIGVAAAVAQARAVGLATYRARFGADELVEVAGAADETSVAAVLRDAVALAKAGRAEPGEAADQLGNEVVAHRSVPAALWIAAVTRSYRDAIELALAVGGDADTIAAMAGAVRGAAEGAGAIPGEWVEAVEGAGLARETARRLAASSD